MEDSAVGFVGVKVIMIMMRLQWKS